MFDPIELARRSVCGYVLNGEIIDTPDDIPDKFQMRAGAFVSIKKKGELRGCIGTFTPFRSNVAEEIIHNAISSATNDPRFSHINEDELDHIEFSVDILEPPEQIFNIGELDPKIYGVIVETGHRRGLLLPDLMGVDAVEQQLAIARQKAGISPNEPVKIYRFKVTRYSEK